MTGLETIEKLSKKYSMSPDEFMRHGSTLAMREKKRNMQIERLDILSRYKADSADGLEDKIKDGKVPEHPAWEDLIEIKNIDAEIKEIESDIQAIQST